MDTDKEPRSFDRLQTSKRAPQAGHRWDPEVRSSNDWVSKMLFRRDRSEKKWRLKDMMLKKGTGGEKSSRLITMDDNDEIIQGRDDVDLHHSRDRDFNLEIHRVS